MLRAATSNERTILDFLNEDCWRILLKHVPVRDLIRSERTSRQWQTRVLTYLHGVRINVVDENDRSKNIRSNACTLKLREDAYESFTMWTSKLGTTVVGVYCNSLESLKIIHENCPFLESLTLINIHIPVCRSGKVFPYNLNKDFKHLRAVSFNSCSVSDQGINQFIADKAIEELEVHSCDVKGDFLNTINLSNLKYLAFETLDAFNFEYFLSAVELLNELKKLVIIDMPFEVVEKMQHVLDKMKKLEYLELHDDTWMDCYDHEPLSRVVHLKYLRASFRVGDDGVEAILQGCKELRTLELSDCRCMSGSVVADALCRYGAQLRSLTLHKFHCMEDDDLVTIIAGCPELSTLVVSEAYLSPALPARAGAAAAAAAAARRGGGARLRLDLSETILADPEQLKGEYGEYEPMKTDYENLIIDLIAKD